MAKIELIEITKSDLEKLSLEEIRNYFLCKEIDDYPNGIIKDYINQQKGITELMGIAAINGIEKLLMTIITEKFVKGELIEAPKLPTETLEEQYTKELLDLSSEELSYKEFEDYINDYNRNPKSYSIDIDSTYYKAIVWASENLYKAFKMYEAYHKLERLRNNL